ncbi:MAG: transketolase, partial [Deltaproteobacteria bacterium]|nr:transketolase [Deltaproteobacteria bacterium]
PAWPNRDRFILSAGHGSALLYALLHLSGYDLPLDELKSFRQWGSKTPGHPECGLTPGVEATTGPLGQGFGMGLGLALAEAFLAASFNRPGWPIIDHQTYVLVSDGDLMEGVSSEAASLAGHLGLGKLICLYDDNRISIEGKTDLTFTEDVTARFQAFGWQTLRVEDGNDLEAVAEALGQAKAETSRPSLIAARTHIGFGSPLQDQAKVHGEPLGPDLTRTTKKNLGWPLEPSFHLPREVLAHFRRLAARGAAWEEEWQAKLEGYAAANPELAQRLKTSLEGRLPQGWAEDIPVFSPEDGPLATRVASGQILQPLARRLKNLIGGSADLAPSTKTLIDGGGDFGPGQFGGRNIHFGVREQAMAAAVNGLALHGGVIPYGATFLVFSDYMRPCLRLAALMNLPSKFVLTHDSVGLGEDGPTHQPVEHLMSLRAIPNLTLIRPADANETAAAWCLALERPGPVVLALTRQKVPVLEPQAVGQGPAKGAYVVAGSQDPELILLATGSEVHLALAAWQDLERQGVRARVVSMPCWEAFEEQPASYQDQVLPPEVKIRLAVEAGASLGWERWVGSRGAVIGLNRFGASAPGPTVLDKLGFNLENVVGRALELLRQQEAADQKTKRSS